MRYSLILIFISFMSASPLYAWHDWTHIAIAKVAGYERWFNATGPDMAKIKAGRREGLNHYYDNPEDKEVTPGKVLGQAAMYNSPTDRTGHIYGAIIGALREYLQVRGEGKYAEYHLAYAIHYMTDLCQPLHNMPFDEFNRENHARFDGVIDDEVFQHMDRIRSYMYPIKIRKNKFEADLGREIARIANISRHLGKRLRKEGRVITRDEAYQQLGHCASLIKAVVSLLGKK
jgi:hypothetical protein